MKYNIDLNGLSGLINTNGLKVTGKYFSWKRSGQVHQIYYKYDEDLDMVHILGDKRSYKGQNKNF